MTEKYHNVNPIVNLIMFKSVKTYEIRVESIEASACVLTLWQVFNPTSRDFRVEGVIPLICFVCCTGMCGRGLRWSSFSLRLGSQFIGVGLYHAGSVVRWTENIWRGNCLQTLAQVKTVAKVNFLSMILSLSLSLTVKCDFSLSIPLY